MALQIPLRSDLPHYDMQVVLEGVTYTLEFRWNARDAAWYMNLMTEAGVAIWMSIKIVVDLPLAFRCKNPLKPPGKFIAFDTTGAKADPGEADLGNRVQLLYFEKSEIG
jgi:hypothetical protein